jgi:ferrochelatase
VVPFLENATRGRGVPRDRLLEVAEHYQYFGGVSPINAQNRALAAALEAELREHGPALPVFLGNRNWHPFVEDVLREMRDRGIRRALALVTSAYSSYSGCRQYREDIARARAAIGDDAPRVDKLRTFHDHPGFIEANAARLRGTLDTIELADRPGTHVVFSAHSIPLSMARCCAYEAQLTEAVALVASAVGVRNWTVAYQSRSGPPHVPWLEPDIADVLTELSRNGARDVVVAPIGFVSDHMEVLYDLDHEAREVASLLGLRFHRAASAGTHPALCVDFAR